MSTRLLFEPWGLGDALIAARILRSHPDRATFTLACRSQWHELIRLASNFPIALAPADLAYTSRTRSGPFDLGNQATHPQPNVTDVYSIRGDLRDYYACHKLYPHASRHFAGWTAFAARRISPLNWLYSGQILEVQNRYQTWAKLLGLPWEAVKRDSNPWGLNWNTHSEGLIHIGAQWSSRQYPHPLELREELSRRFNLPVKLIAGPNDALPSGVTPSDICRPEAAALMELIKKSRWIITNDSGPMHLASYLGAQVFAIARISNIKEWLPPGARAICSPSMPLGYRPDPHYTSDLGVGDWPSLTAIAESLSPTVSDTI